MMVKSRILVVATCFGALILAPCANAQNSNVSLNAPGFLIKKPKPGLPDVRAQPLAWPRLDPGAVLCRSEADLTRLAERRAGEAVDGPVDCQIVQAATAVTIVQRKSLGLTEVKTTDPKVNESGWTDAWLPEKAPSLATSAAQQISR